MYVFPWALLPGVSPVAVLGLLGHACERGFQAAQVIVELTGITQQQQVLVLVLLTDPTTVGGNQSSVNVVAVAIFETGGLRNVSECDQGPGVHYLHEPSESRL